MEHASTIFANIAGAWAVIARGAIRGVNAGAILAQKLIRAIRIIDALRVVYACVGDAAIIVWTVIIYRTLHTPVFRDETMLRHRIKAIPILITTGFALTRILITPHALAAITRCASSWYALPVNTRIPIRAVTIVLALSFKNTPIIYAIVSTGTISIGTTLSAEHTLIVLAHICRRTIFRALTLSDPCTSVFQTRKPGLAIGIRVTFRLQNTTAINAPPPAGTIKVRPAGGVILAPGIHTIVVRRTVCAAVAFALVDAVLIYTQVEVRTVHISKTLGTNPRLPLVIHTWLSHWTSGLVTTINICIAIDAPAVCTSPALPAITVRETFRVEGDTLPIHTLFITSTIIVRLAQGSVLALPIHTLVTIGTVHIHMAFRGDLASSVHAFVSIRTLTVDTIGWDAMFIFADKLSWTVHVA